MLDNAQRQLHTQKARFEFNEPPYRAMVDVGHSSTCRAHERYQPWTLTNSLVLLLFIIQYGNPAKDVVDHTAIRHSYIVRLQTDIPYDFEAIADNLWSQIMFDHTHCQLFSHHANFESNVFEHRALVEEGRTSTYLARVSYQLWNLTNSS